MKFCDALSARIEALQPGDGRSAGRGLQQRALDPGHRRHQSTRQAQNEVGRLAVAHVERAEVVVEEEVLRDARENISDVPTQVILVYILLVYIPPRLYSQFKKKRSSYMKD